MRKRKKAQGIRATRTGSSSTNPLSGPIHSKEALGRGERIPGDLGQAGLERIQKASKKACRFLDRLGCQKGRFWEPFWEGKSVQNCILTKLDAKHVIFHKSVFFGGASTILKDHRAWKSNKNGSKTLLRGNFFALKFRSRILIDFGSVLVPFWLPKCSSGRPVPSHLAPPGSKKMQKNV